MFFSVRKEKNIMKEMKFRRLLVLVAVCTFLEASCSVVNARDLPNCVHYQVHMQTYGWSGVVGNGVMAGTTGQAKRLEAIQIWGPGIQYRVHMQGKGWSPGWVNGRPYNDRGEVYHNGRMGGGQYAGTVGEGRRLEAIQIRQKPETTLVKALRYDVVYRVHMQGKGWGPWVKNGQTAGTTGEGRRIEAIQIRAVQPATW